MVSVSQIFCRCGAHLCFLTQMDRSDTVQCIDWRSVDKTCSRFRALYQFSLHWMTFTFGCIPMQIVHTMLRGKSQKRTVWVQIDIVLCDPTVLRGKCWQLGQQTFCPQGEIVSALVLILHIIINAVLVVSFTILDHHQHRRHHHKYHRAISTLTFGYMSRVKTLRKINICNYVSSIQKHILR